MAPIMRGLTSSQSARGTASALVSALEQARNAAVTSGTNGFLALPDANTTTLTNDYQLRSYAVIRSGVDLNGDNVDDVLNIPLTSFVLLSKWERLPGDLQFSQTSLNTLSTINPTGLTLPGNVAASPLRVVEFDSSGALVNKTATIRLLFASSNKVTNGWAVVADRIEISPYSGRVRYAGLTNNIEF